MANPTDYNMMYISEFKRYYFIGWENITNNLWRVYATSIDVLFTYKHELLGLNCIIDKQEFRHNNLVDDGSYIKQVDTFTEIAQYPSGFSDDPNYILLTA